jgi:hypothetical protein
MNPYKGFGCHQELRTFKNGIISKISHSRMFLPPHFQLLPHLPFSLLLTAPSLSLVSLEASALCTPCQAAPLMIILCSTMMGLNPGPSHSMEVHPIVYNFLLHQPYHKKPGKIKDFLSNVDANVSEPSPSFPRTKFAVGPGHRRQCVDEIRVKKLWTITIHLV